MNLNVEFMFALCLFLYVCNAVVWQSCSIHHELLFLLCRWSSSGVNAVLACSALKRSYRHILLFGLTEENLNDQIDVGKEACRNLNQPQQLNECVDSSLASKLVVLQKCLHGQKHSLLFIFLKTSQEALIQRLKERSGHYMPSSLLQSQLETLEEPDYPEQFIMLDGDKSVSQIIEESLAAANMIMAI